MNEYGFKEDVALSRFFCFGILFSILFVGLNAPIAAKEIPTGHFFDRWVDRCVLSLLRLLPIENKAEETKEKSPVPMILAKDALKMLRVMRQSEERDEIIQRMINDAEIEFEVDQLIKLNRLIFGVEIHELALLQIVEKRASKIEFGDLALLLGEAFQIQTSDLMVWIFMRKKIDHFEIEDIPELVDLVTESSLKTELIKEVLRLRSEFADLENLRILRKAFLPNRLGSDLVIRLLDEKILKEIESIRFGI